jgi:hypothetical protein
LINAATGDYSFFCNGMLIASGRGTPTVKGCEGTIEHNKGDRRVLISWDTTANAGKGSGTAIVQVGVNNTRCQITDKDMSNNACFYDYYLRSAASPSRLRLNETARCAISPMYD